MYIIVFYYPQRYCVHGVSLSKEYLETSQNFYNGNFRRIYMYMIYNKYNIHFILTDQCMNHEMEIQMRPL